MLVLKRRRNAITIQIEMVVGRSILLYHLYPEERVGGLKFLLEESTIKVYGDLCSM